MFTVGVQPASAADKTDAVTRAINFEDLIDSRLPERTR
jgi:hypothetical protein